MISKFFYVKRFKFIFSVFFIFLIMLLLCFCFFSSLNMVILKLYSSSFLESDLKYVSSSGFWLMKYEVLARRGYIVSYELSDKQMLFFYWLYESDLLLVDFSKMYCGTGKVITGSVVDSLAWSYAGYFLVFLNSDLLYGGYFGSVSDLVYSLRLLDSNLEDFRRM